MSCERILFVTGRLAEFSLRRVLETLSRQVGFEYDVAVLGISVAALMHVDWVQRKLEFSKPFDRVILPGMCQGDPGNLEERFHTPFELGPKNLHDLPEHFGRQGKSAPDFSRYDIDILAEINHAPRLSDTEILKQAASFRESGADLIDLGCVPGETWSRAGDVTRLLVNDGYRVSIDSFNQREVASAAGAGAELVLSVNSSNLDWAVDLDVELVAIPDEPGDAASLDQTIGVLTERGVRFRVDPILEPIGFGFAASLARYFELRRRRPDVPMMMGIGNLTELTEVDSAGVNFLLAGICQELGVHSVLTTEVINWARTSVREFDIARRVIHYCFEQKVLPKHLDSQLVMLRDAKVRALDPTELDHLAGQLTDPNFRIFVERGGIHLMNRDGHWRGTDAYELFDRVVAESEDIDTQHAFYLGYELAKAVTALTLGKQYTQDDPLRWGFLTVPEPSAHERRKKKSNSKDS